MSSLAFCHRVPVKSDLALAGDVTALAVCFDAGWIDPGYINRLTLEIYNLNERETVLLPVGERFAQIVFHETGEVDGNYGSGRDGGFSGKYQQGTDIDTIIKTWSPDMMLPKAYKDTGHDAYKN